MRKWIFGISVCILSACFTTDESKTGPCYDLCNELYGSCDYAAFPNMESCLEGCLYNENEGADIQGQLECMLEAGCDTFKVLECENNYGATSDD